ncbi:MAG: hypothetical protein KOO63_02945 [Bacteroidales bacterium]|nr:hypothetical protein [Candidatus Latescibacterota bacterium]
MARTRKTIRKVIEGMWHEIQGDHNHLWEHNCHEIAQTRVFTGCLLCFAYDAKLVFTYTTVARQYGLLGTDLLKTEQALLDIVGTIKYNAMVQEQMRQFMSGPTQRCDCGAEVRIYKPYGKVWRKVNRQGPIHTNCPTCANIITFNRQIVQTPRYMLKRAAANLTEVAPIGEEPAPRRRRAGPAPVTAPRATFTFNPWILT